MLEVMASGKPSVLVILGSPYLARNFPEAEAILLTLSTADVSERAAVRALFGQTKISGKLPVTIPETAAPGFPPSTPGQRPLHSRSFR